MKDLYIENCKILMKSIEEDTNKRKDISHLRTGIISVVKSLYCPKESTDTVQFLSQFQEHFIAIEEIILKFV